MNWARQYLELKRKLDKKVDLKLSPNMVFSGNVEEKLSQLRKDFYSS